MASKKISVFSWSYSYFTKSCRFFVASRGWIQYSTIQTQILKTPQVIIVTIKIMLFRSSHKRWSMQKAVLKNFAIFTGKHLCWRLLIQHRCFLCEFFKSTYFEELLRTPASCFLFIKPLVFSQLCRRKCSIDSTSAIKNR